MDESMLWALEARLDEAHAEAAALRERCVMLNVEIRRRDAELARLRAELEDVTPGGEHCAIDDPSD